MTASDVPSEKLYPIVFILLTFRLRFERYWYRVSVITDTSNLSQYR